MLMIGCSLSSHHPLPSPNSSVTHFQIILHPMPKPSSLLHSQTKPSTGSIMLFNMAYRPSIQPLLASPASCPSAPILPIICSRHVLQFGSSVGHPSLVLCLHMWLSSPFNILPIHRHYHQTIFYSSFGISISGNLP